MGMLLGTVIYKVCVLGKKVTDFASVRGPSSHVISEHDYETIKPLSPHMMSYSEQETGFREDPYIPTWVLEKIYDDFVEDSNYTLDKMNCSCQCACNCPTYT